VTVTHLPDASSPPRVAYSVGKRVGPAVVRNRVKRRLRAIVADLAPGPGAYLVSVRPEAAVRSYDELSVDVHGAFARLDAGGSP
jgi:ribonuclease P protein component